MRDTGCPPFFEVMSYLFCSILSIAMIGYLLLWLVAGNVQAVPFDVWVLFLAFGAIIVYSGAKLIQGLFPARWRPGAGGLLVVKVLEIDLQEE